MSFSSKYLVCEGREIHYTEWGAGHAQTVIAWHGSGDTEYVPMPEDLKPAYQAFTEAELTRLRAAGYDDAFAPIEDGVRRTLDALAQPPAR